jgi:hypothetical protein
VIRLASHALMVAALVLAGAAWAVGRVAVRLDR